MNNQTALDIVLEFKGKSLTDQLTVLISEIIGKTKDDIPERTELFNAALTVKKASAQINEIVHAIGILNSLKKILDNGELVEKLSLAAGAEGDGFDLETNLRLAEFKFSRWQEGGSKNGMRKRHIFADFANLTISQTSKRKELYTVSADQIIKYFNGRANWKKVLSKSGKIQYELGDYLYKIGRTEIKTLNEVYSISTVEIIELDQVLETKI